MRWLAVILAVTALGWSPRTWQPDEMLENTQVCSGDRRLCVVVREYPETSDFGSIRADEVYDFDGEELGRRVPQPERLTAAIYKNGVLADTMLLPESFAEVLVSESGRFVVITRFDDSRIDVRTAAGDEHTLTPRDVFAPGDLEAFTRGLLLVRTSLRSENDRDLLAITLRDYGEITIDLETCARLGPMLNLYPAARTWVTAPDYIPHEKRARWSAWSCPEVAAEHLSSGVFLDRAVARPLPPYPVVAQKARISGSVYVDVVVGADGNVVCTRTTPLPFGVSQAAEDAVRQWKFTPSSASFGGALEFHFGLLNDVEWVMISP